jgi:hypothetical protein
MRALRAITVATRSSALRGIRYDDVGTFFYLRNHFEALVSRIEG